MHMAISTCRALTLSHNIFFIDVLKRQEELDGQRNMAVLSLGCQSLDLIGNAIKKAANPTSIFSRSWEKVSLGIGLLPLGYLGMFFKKSLYVDKLDQVIQKGSKWLDVAKFVGVVALFYLKSFETATAILVGLSLAHLQKNSQLPPAIYRAIQFFSTPLLLAELLLSPITGILSLLSKIFIGLALAEKLNTYMLTKERGIDFASMHLIAPNQVDAQQVGLYAHRLNSSLHVNPVRDLEFDTSSVHRIPQYLDIQIQDNLQEATKEQILEAFTKKVEDFALQEHLQKGFERLQKTYLLGNGSDVLPVQWSKFETMFGLFLRHLITLDKGELEPILKNLNAVGNHCVDGWVGELGAIFPDTQYSGFTNKIHAYFAEIRTEQLNGLIIFFHQMAKNKFFGLIGKLIDLTGGINDVHYIQHLHLAFRPVWRTKLAEFALTSTANHQDLGSYLYHKYIFKMFSKHKQSLPEMLDSAFWIKELMGAMRPEISILEQKNGSERVLKVFQKISSQDLFEWIGRNREKYPLADDSFNLNPEFFTMIQDDAGGNYLQLTQKGAALVLLDAGVLRLKTQ